MAILFQPVVEPDFWNQPGNFLLWILNATFGYLVFGIFIWLGKSLISIGKNSISTNATTVIAVAVIASMARSFSIGSLMEPFGLDGVSSIERLPFGAVLGFAWVFTSSLIMDTKYRFKLHLDEVVSVQRALLDLIHDVQEKIFEKAKVTAKENLEISHRQLQQSIRELAILSNSTTSWAALVPQLRVATMRLALVDKKTSWTADKDLNELKSTQWQAIREIATKPLMNLPLVITATAVVTFLGGIRLYPVDFVVTSIIVALGLHVAIILGTRIVIQRQSEPSTFSFAVMLAALFLTSALLSTIPGYLSYDRASLIGIALAATIFEVVWLIASGYVIFNQNQRQEIIANAQLENERLQDAIRFIGIVKSDLEKFQYKPTESFDLISEQINRAQVDAHLQLARGALEFSSILFGEIADLLSGTSESFIEQTLNRVSTTLAATTEVLWTITGSQIPDSLQPRISAALEICVSKAIRHGEANVVSVDVRGHETGAEIKVTDNGHAHDDGGVGLGVEILLELSNSTWERNRAGGLNIVTAQFSDQ
jgi:hypothetical protein